MESTANALCRDEAIRSVAGAEIPNHLRDSILRLVEQQAIEAEEQARALAEAQGGPSRGRDTWEMDGEHDDDADVRRVRVAGAGDASGDEDAEGDKEKTVDVGRISISDDSDCRDIKSNHSMDLVTDTM